MSSEVSGYRYISVNYLYEGLVLDNDIYDSSGYQTLLTKDTVLHQNHIKRLKQLMDADQNIRVSADMHKKLLNKGIPGIYEQQHLEDNVGYTQAKAETASLFHDAEATGTVSYEKASDITDSISDKLNKVDPALIFQCINGHNMVDEYLYRHSVNVAMINGLMGKWLKLGPEEVNLLVIGGLIHDIGKTMVPQDILNAQRKLTDEEFEIIKKHSSYSYDIISQNKNFSDDVCEMALHHHEKMNGSGYPGGLVADNIPLYARITSVSDVYDAMVSQRCYKKANSPFMILADLADQKFSDLDMILVEVFARIMPFELVGKAVLMSDGSCAVVRHVDPEDMEFPYVEMSAQVFKTSSLNHCVSMIPDDLDVEISSHFSHPN